MPALLGLAIGAGLAASVTGWSSTVICWRAWWGGFNRPVVRMSDRIERLID